MNPGDEIDVRNGYANKTVKVLSVTRGRVMVDWPLVGEYAVDLLTGRVAGTRSSVAVDDMPRLDSLRIGESLRLDNGARGEVVDALPSEGTVKVFVANSAHSGVWRTGSLRSTFKVSAQVLTRLRQAAGLVSAMAG